MLRRFPHEFSFLILVDRLECAIVYHMIMIVHGDDITASRSYFIAQKEQSSDSVTLQGALMTLNDVIQAVEGQGLFSEGKHIFVEEFLTKRKAGKETNSIIAKLIENEKNNDIFLWESKDLTATQLKHFKDAVVKQFKITKTIFQFVDSIKPKNTKPILTLFHRTTKTEEVEYVFFMIVRQVRLLLALFDEGTESIDEVKRMAPWQKSKLQKQAKLFTIESLKNLYQKLFELDLAMKTGGLVMPLTESIDFLLLEI